MAQQDPFDKKILLLSLNFMIGMAKVILLGVCLVLLYTFFGDNFAADWSKKSVPLAQTGTKPVSRNIAARDEVENGIHLTTGLIYDANFEVVRANCTACHSGKLVAQNRATREGWRQMIRWMQKTQGLWDLGVNETKILDYLEKNYAPTEVGRRANIDVAAVEWYILELD